MTKQTPIIKKPKGVLFIISVLQNLNLEYSTEHKFDTNRKFRFDIAIHKIKTAVEYEGIFTAKSRHTTLSGYSTDTEKYNLAQTQGWKVLRYTASNYKNFEQDINKLIK